MYLVEEGILEHFRESGYTPREMFEENGLCLEIVESSARILHALHMDDLVRVEVKPNLRSKDKSCLNYKVRVFVDRDEKELKAVIANVKVLFQQDSYEGDEASAVKDLAPYVVSEVNRAKDVELVKVPSADRAQTGMDSLISQVVPEGSNAFVWKWHIPYFYCHFTNRMQHSGYLRLMEEVVDLFLADRGISIWKMLDTKRWIPVVPSANVEILREARMEETIYTVYTVEDIFKDTTYTSRMDCYVERDGKLVHTATGKITHGYAVIEDRCDWSLVTFDEETVAALRGESKSHEAAAA